MKCWGNDGSWQLGDNTSQASMPYPVLVDATNFAGPAGVKDVSIGVFHACALLSTGAVKCWGSNSSGQVGVVSGSIYPTPQDVESNGILFKRLGGGVYTQCAIAAASGDAGVAALTGQIYCWGSNSYGQVGDGTTTNRFTPTRVQNLDGGVAVAVSSGANYTCGVLSDQTVRCWGRNEYGQLGNADAGTGAFLAPQVVAGLGEVREIAVGSTSACAILANGTGRCWGDNSSGQLGTGAVGGVWDTPQPVVNLSNVVSISAGFHHYCALKADGTVSCWGRNYEGQVEDGGGADISAPTVVSGFAESPKALVSGTYHNCVLTASGNVYCWGGNSYGETGVADGDAGKIATPAIVSSLSDIRALFHGIGNHACAIRSDGSLVCWGWDGLGQLGDGVSGGSRYTPGAVQSLP
jgi:alpha-tubulin suppressor-like RCC1 family protein